MAKYAIEDTTLTNIANAIRGKEGTTDAIPVASMAERIAGLPSGGEWTIFDNLPFSCVAGDAPGMYITTIDVSGVDLSDKKCVLVTIERDTVESVAWVLDRNSTNDDFKLWIATERVNISTAIIGDTQWVFKTGFYTTNTRFKIKAL